MTNQVTIHVNITGRVQGVFFRAYTQKAAQELGINGYVKNMPDGSVQAVFQGGQEQIDQMVAWCHTGSPSSSVAKVRIEKAIDTAAFHRFDIQY
jgi:acylphosphatase